MTSATTNKGKQLELEVADAYRRLGARTVVHDVEIAGHQIDVYVELETVDRSLHRIAVEAKNYSSKVGIKIVSDFIDIVDRLRRQQLIDQGVIVSATGYSRQARNAAQTHCVRLLERVDLETMIAEATERAGSPDKASLESAPTLPSPPPEAPATIEIQAGPFWRGSALEDPDADENEKPRREVYLPTYEIGHYPVTNAQYACFLVDSPHHPVPYSEKEEYRLYSWDPRTRMYPEGRADHPVALVSWEDAIAYCRWLSQVTGQHYRLPTEEEWEKAARGSSPEERTYPWGDEWWPDRCNTKELGQSGTTSVHKFERVYENPFGVVDMAGNVWEWTASWYGRYPDSTHHSLHYGRTHRVVRGGSWQRSSWDARISCRGRYKPKMIRPYLGFRILLEVFD